MPVYRTPDGRIVEEKTEVPLPGGGAEKTAGDRGETTVRREGGAAKPAKPSARGGGRYTDTTVVRRPGGGKGGTQTADRPAGDEPTRLVGAIPKGGASETDDVDPVSGWLVVVEGPGKGRDVRIGTGRNDLGRAEDNRIALPFGDTRISRKAHLWITYDPRHRTFSVAPGERSANLAYVNDSPIDTRLPLEDGATITVGQTTLHFVAFCGDRFHWSDAG